MKIRKRFGTKLWQIKLWSNSGKGIGKMCRCGGASEHEHLSGQIVKFTKSLHSFLISERIYAINVKNPSKCSESVFREHFYPIEGTESLVSDSDDQIIIHVL